MTATVDLPTPPLQELTAMIFFTVYSPYVLLLAEPPSALCSFGAISTITLCAHGIALYSLYVIKAFAFLYSFVRFSFIDIVPEAVSIPKE